MIDWGMGQQFVHVFKERIGFLQPAPCMHRFFCFLFGPYVQQRYQPFCHHLTWQYDWL
jgi:hypothetical protein